MKKATSNFSSALLPFQKGEAPADRSFTEHCSSFSSSLLLLHDHGVRFSVALEKPFPIPRLIRADTAQVRAKRIGPTLLWSLSLRPNRLYCPLYSGRFQQISKQRSILCCPVLLPMHNGAVPPQTSTLSVTPNFYCLASLRMPSNLVTPAAQHQRLRVSASSAPLPYDAFLISRSLQQRISMSAGRQF